MEDGERPLSKIMSCIKRICLLVLLGLAGLSMSARSGMLKVSESSSFVYNHVEPKHEVRAVWLTTIGGIDWPHSYSQSSYSAQKQQKELVGILDKLQEAHINTVLVQTRIRGTMIYPSAYEPWDGCLSGFPGKSPGYDALKFVIDECHKRGMELHAWVVTIPVGRWDALGCKRLRSRFPGLIRKIGAEGYMNPEDARTANYLADVCGEIARKYDIDGIHLDYIRYPETWNIKVSREKGRYFITHIVQKIHDAVKKEKPWVKMSCSPIGKFDDLARYWSHGWNAYTKVCQDAQGWLRAGLMDELFPMMYFRNEQFFPFAIDWAEQSDGKIVVPGLGIYFLDPKEGKWKIGDVTKEMYHLRNLGLGYAFFRNKFFLDNTQGIYDFTKQEFNRYLSLVPPMTWVSDKKPLAPQRFVAVEKDGGVTLSWNNVARYEDGSQVAGGYIYNNVYASRTYPVDVTDARNLVVTRTTRTSLSLKDGQDGQPLYFALTAMDKYGNESVALQSHDRKVDDVVERVGKANRLPCDGEKVLLASIQKNVDTSMFLVESMGGQVLSSMKCVGNYLYINGLNEGMYVLKSVNKKGVSHAVGTFIYRKNKKS